MANIFSFDAEMADKKKTDRKPKAADKSEVVVFPGVNVDQLKRILDHQKRTGQRRRPGPKDQN